MIIKRQTLQRSSLSSSSSSFLLSLIIIIRHYHYHYHYQQNHHRLRGCCYRLMATASSLFQSNKHLRCRQYHHPSPNLTLIHRCFPYTRCVKPLSLTNCADTKSLQNQNQIENPQAFAPNLSLPLPQLVHNQARSSINGHIISEFHHGTPLVSTDQPSPEKIIVAVDVDEVLGNFVSALNRFIADRYSSNHSVSEYHVYEFFKIWNCSRDEADIRVHEFFQTCYFKTGIHPIPGARQALQKLARFCKLSVVTSRQNAIRDHTIGWLDRHYPGLFEEIHFGNHFALEGLSRCKSDICRSLGAKVLIDDNPRYAIECAEVGIRVLLFDYENSYPWCKIDSVSQHPLVTKVHNWEEVEHQLVSGIVS